MSEPLQEPVDQTEPVELDATAEPAEPAWTPSREEWDQYTQAVNYIAQQINPQDQPQIDMFDPQAVQGYIQQQIDQRLAQEASLAEADDRAWEIIDGYSKDQPFLFDGSRERARDIAQQVYLPQTQQQYGFGQKAATEALRLAVEHVRGEEDAIGKAYYEKQTQHLRGLGSVRREPAPAGQSGAASQLIHESGPGDELAVLSKYFRG